jgi:hypothetical protein
VIVLINIFYLFCVVFMSSVRELNCHTVYIYVLRSWNSSVGIATGYELNGRGFIPDRGKRFFSTPLCPYRF